MILNHNWHDKFRNTFHDHILNQEYHYKFLNLKVNGSVKLPITYDVVPDIGIKTILEILSIWNEKFKLDYSVYLNDNKTFVNHWIIYQYKPIYLNIKYIDKKGYNMMSNSALRYDILHDLDNNSESHRKSLILSSKIYSTEEINLCGLIALDTSGSKIMYRIYGEFKNVQVYIGLFSEIIHFSIGYQYNEKIGLKFYFWDHNNNILNHFTFACIFKKIMNIFDISFKVNKDDDIIDLTSNLKVQINKDFSFKIEISQKDGWNISISSKKEIYNYELIRNNQPLEVLYDY